MFVGSFLAFVASPAAGAQAGSTRFLGAVLSRAESPSVTIARDAGFSVPLPNGSDFWLFADTPLYNYTHGGWRFTAFAPGSSAAMGKFTPGRPLSRHLIEIHPGRKLRPSNKPAQFLATPKKVYMPGKQGKACHAANGKSPKGPARRWPTGAALMPDKTNILITYAVACVPSLFYFAVEGWGYALFNWKTRKFSQPPFDVFKPKKNAFPLADQRLFGSPVIVRHKVTFFSSVCCSAGPGEYATTVNLTRAALRNPASYRPVLLSNVPATFDLDVAPRSAHHARYTMLNLRGGKGEYDIYAAAKPTGPWSPVASGVVPKCDSSPYPCHSFILHPELSPSSRLVVSYFVPGYGPGNASKHPFPHDPLRHVVLASIPCSC